MTLLVTGGAGFIGSNFVLDWLAGGGEPVLNLDKLTYAGNLANLASLQDDARHRFVQGDIGDTALLERLLAQHRPRAVVNFAAESHVDRSIHGPGEFIQTNVVGTFRLLEATRQYWQALPATEKEAFRFLHVSTDEVYGTLAPDAPAFTETLLKSIPAGRLGTPEDCAGLALALCSNAGAYVTGADLVVDGGFSL